MAFLLRVRYRVKVATDGDVALQIASSAPPDLIRLDVVMPGVDGYEVCRRLKSGTGTFDVPVIFLSSLNEDHDETRGFEETALDIRPPSSISRTSVTQSWW